MRYEFDFQMNEKVLGDFYTRSNVGGFMWPVFGVFAIVLAIISGGTTPVAYRILYAFFPPILWMLKGTKKWNG